MDPPRVLHPTGFGTHALDTPIPEMFWTNGQALSLAAMIAPDAGGALEATTVAGKLIRRGRRQGADRSSSDVTALGGLVSSQEDARRVDLGADGEPDTRRATSKESLGSLTLWSSGRAA
jgi:hypothetical protein